MEIEDRELAKRVLAGQTNDFRLLVDRHQQPERGDMVAFYNPTDSEAEAFVMRVVAVAGDKIEIIGDRVLINGVQLERELVAEDELALGEQVSVFARRDLVAVWR